MYPHKRGLIVIFGTALFSYLLLIGHHWILNDWWTYAPIKYLAKFGSYTATILFCWNFILASKWQWLQKLLGGQDKVYKAHQYVGIASFLLVLLHPLGLSLMRWPRWSSMLNFYTFREFASNYSTGHNIGLILIILLVCLLGFAAWTKLPYQAWKWLHRGFHVFLWLMVAHVILVDAEIGNHIVLKVWFYGWFIAAGIASIYSLLYYFVARKYEYTVSAIEYFDDSVEITLSPQGKHLPYLPSQFVYISFKNKSVGAELHPYSIASAPNAEGVVKLGIKFLGDHTKKLGALQKGDAAVLYGPFGSFSEKFLYGGRDCVFIGGGIGITPFLGMWKTALCSDEQVDVVTRPGRFTFDAESICDTWKSPHVHMCYLVKNRAEATFLNDIEQVAICSQFQGFRKFGLRGHAFEVQYSEETGRLKIAELAERVPHFTDRNFFLCGPKPMVNGMITDLNSLGIKNSRIHVEEFNYRQLPTLMEVRVAVEKLIYSARTLLNKKPRHSITKF